MASKQGPSDTNENAFRIMLEATGDAPGTVPQEKSESAVKRGQARVEKLTADQRSEIARIAAKKRCAH